MLYPSRLKQDVIRIITPPNQIESIMVMRFSSQMEIRSVSEYVPVDLTRMYCPVISVTGFESGSMMIKVDNTVITIIQIAMVEMVYRTWALRPGMYLSMIYSKNPITAICQSE
jgi:hypothetical protein